MVKKLHLVLVFSTLFFFGLATYMESTAWARAGGGRSMGSRGSKSFSSPSSPSQTGPGMSSPGRNALPGGPTQPSSGFFSRSPFMQGLAGGLAGGMIGSLLFGGMGHAAGGGYAGGGGIGLMDLVLLGLLLYLAYRFFKRRREQTASAGAGYFGTSAPQEQNYTGYPQSPYTNPPESPQGSALGGFGQAERGIDAVKRYDPNFNEDQFKETAQDLFFRIQGGWTNRSLEGIEGILTPEMAEFFKKEFDGMRQKGVINRLENIAVRRVEITEAWQEMGKEYITVLFTANLLDYTVNAETREVVDGDKMTPVKFQEFWTFCRDIGSNKWQLSAINQME